MINRPDIGLFEVTRQNKLHEGYTTKTVVWTSLKEKYDERVLAILGT
jgi:hypothetical protein